MRKMLLFTFGIILSLSMTGCGSMFSSVAGKGFANSTKGTIKNMLELRSGDGTKSVILVPVVNVGKESQYAEIASILNALKSEGYVTFCEGFMETDYPVDTTRYLTMSEVLENWQKYNTVRNSSAYDITSRKFRRIFNCSPGNENPDVKLKKGKVLLSASLLGTTTERDYWTDYTVKDYVEIYESKFGEIGLTSFDRSYPLDAPGYAKTRPDRRGFQMIGSAHFDPKNIRLSRAITDSEFDKIVVVYGSPHTLAIKHMLVNSTKGYEKVKKDFRR